MELLKEADFRRQIKTAPHAGYLFFGDEDYLKLHACRQLREIICPDPSFAFFNDLRLDAMDLTPGKLADALMPMPMMAERKLVTVTGLNFNTMRQSELDALCETLELLEEYDYNTLVITVAADALNPGYLPKRPSATLQALAKRLTPVQFDTCSTAKLAAWVQKHFAHHGIEADAAVCSFLPERCGHSMFVLANEIDKLAHYLLAHGRTAATVEDVKEVCVANDEYDAFAFTNAIMEGRQEEALAILADLRFRRVDPLILLGEATRVICDMIGVYAMTREGVPAAEIASVLGLHAFKVGLYQKALRATNAQRLSRALEACNAADAALKLSPQGYAALEILICKIN